MQLNPSTMFSVMLLILIAFQSYSSLHYLNMIWCTFRRVDRIRVAKWAKAGQARIEFDGGWYQVEAGRITIGIKWMPLPMVVKCLDFRHDNSRALDPDTFDNTYTPEARKQLDITDGVRGFEQGNREALTGKVGKQGFLQQYQTLIVVIGFLIVGWLLWQQRATSDKLGYAMNVIQAQLGQLLQK